MNTQTIRDELHAFVYENFDEQDTEVLEKLAEIFIQSYNSYSPNNIVSCYDILNLDTLINLAGRSTDTSNRGKVYHLILKHLSPRLIHSTNQGARGRGAKSQIVFNSFEAFIQACLLLRGPKALQISAFSAKCTAMVVRLHVALEADLRKTKQELSDEREEIQRRCFLIIKQSVREWRAANGYPFTDARWRYANFTRCVKGLLGTVYLKGATPYVQKEYLEKATTAIQAIYERDQRNPDFVDRSPPLEQPTLYNHFGIVSN
jgi:hypothetical protein